ncbi:MAG: zf-TFIIB domain-containing protein [Labilithrix sp.]|nr:zf-TFIIB domain-containing protein [Labilithrix sp.]MCW5833801.1 zf-TFIIB domain-containing protein [Labilithrix sp.]
MPAPAARRSATCPFCGAAVAPPPAVEVVERVVQRVVVADVGSGGARCPRCAGELREGRVRDAHLRGCLRCAGLWVDNATVDALRERTDSDVEALARELTRVIATPVPHEQRVAELACPACATTMRRVAIPDTVYSVDVCDEHGTWFDRDELAMFAAAFRDRRAGALTEDDLKNAGLPAASPREGGGGFFSDLFASIGALMRGHGPR